MSPVNKQGEPLHQIEVLKRGAKDKGKLRDSEWAIRISHTEKGRPFTFYLKGTHLVADPGHEVKSAKGQNVSEDWYEALTEREKVDLMEAVAAYYRKPSLDRDGVKTAAVGVVQNADPYAKPRNRNLLYVGINTTHLVPADNYKGCAEDNMIRSVAAAIARFMHYERGGNLPEAPFLKELFVMGGRIADRSDSKDKGVHGICPCGPCTDLLAQVMLPGSKIYIYPHTDGQSRLPINEAAKKYSDVATNHIWKTDIETLNANRKVHLRNKTLTEMQVTGLRAMAECLASGYVPPPRSEEVLKKNDENFRSYRTSIPELDIATKNGSPDITAVNDYLWRELALILNDRLHLAQKEGRLPPYGELTADAVLDWMNKKVKTVCCSVIQTDQGAYYPGYDSQTGSDKAFVNPQFTALGAAVKVLGTQGVKRIWSMELNPLAIKAGYMMTPSKDGLERSYKRPTKLEGETLRVCSLPFNDGKLSPELLAAIADECTYGPDTIYVGGFPGNGRAERGLNGGSVAHSDEANQLHGHRDRLKRKLLGPGGLQL